MTEEEKKIKETTEGAAAETAAPSVAYTPNEYKSQYETQIKDLYGQISSRPSFEFNYNPSDDALYNQYMDRYMQLGKEAMRDTMGQASALTGGYGNSYAQRAGQQAYDAYIQGTNDKLGEMADRAYSLQYQKYLDEGAALDKQYSMLGDLEAMDYSKYMDRVAAQDAAWQKLAAVIPASGYMPSESELEAANMTTEQAKALQAQFAAAYPQLAYLKGIITADEHLAITGAYPVGYNAPATGGGGFWDGGHWGPGGGGGGDDPGGWGAGVSDFTMKIMQNAVERGQADVLNNIYYTPSVYDNISQSQADQVTGWIEKER